MGSPEPFPLHHSSLYTAWLMERKQIEAHKWVLSERAGYDVGWDAARFNWDMCHRAAWVRNMQARGLWPSS